MNESDKVALAVYKKMMEKDYFSQWMGIEPLSIKEGYCKLRMKITQTMLNGYNILHGGVTFAFADSAFAFASNSYDRLSVSMNGTMHYSKSAKEGDCLIAEAKMITLGNKTATFDVLVFQESTNETVSLFRGTVYRTSSSVIEKV